MPQRPCALLDVVGMRVPAAPVKRNHLALDALVLVASATGELVSASHLLPLEDETDRHDSLSAVESLSACGQLE